MTNIVYNCDCVEFLERCKINQFDLTFSDPPYGIGVDGVNIIKNKSGDQNHHYDHSKMWDSEIPDSYYFHEIIIRTKNQIIWGGNYFLNHLGYCKAPIIWDKLNGNSMYADGEFAWTSKGLPKNLRIFKHQWCGAFKDSERKTIKIHPTQKPIALYKWLLKNYAKPGWTIFDSHVGSGSSRIACYDMGFDFVGCEIDSDYYQAQEERFKNHIAQGNLFDAEELQKNIFGEAELL
jgi:site-specific DNA-methyltransferase (adenine-specific)